MHNFRFYKTDNRWFIDYPDFLKNGGELDELEMVLGADTMLDILAQGEDSVHVSFSDTYFPESSSLVYTGSDGYYTCTTIKGIPYNFTVWLCSVTLTIFPFYPSIIYFK